MEQARLVHLSMEIWGIIFAMLAYFCEWMGRKTDRNIGKKVRTMLIMVIMLLLGDACAWAFRGNPSTLGVVATRVSNASVFFLQPSIAVIFLSMMCLYEEEADWKRHVRTISSLILAGLAVLLVVNLFVPYLYAFDETNHYYRLPGNFIIYIPSFLLWLLGVYSAFRNRKQWSVTMQTEIIVLFGGIMVTMVLQMLLYGFSYTILAFTMGVLLITFMHQAEKANELLRKENELKDMQMLQLRNQMQPHFIFNSLTTIRSLIRRNPDEAYLAVTDFSRYLRGSLTSLSDVREWTIDQEMQMVEGYLALEKRRFGDGLQITIEMKDTDFLVPVLVVQTLVENAVRHGIRAMTQGSGELLVRTERQGAAHVVIVKDNGVGFDPGAPFPDDEGRPHTGLSNTRRRVEEKGEMLLESAPGKGTRVTLKFFE